MSVWPARCQAVCKMLGTRHPIVAAPMAGVTNVEMVAAASNCGILGVHGIAYKTPEEVASELQQISKKTTSPFGLNFFVVPSSRPEDATSEELKAARESLTRFDQTLSLNSMTDTPLKKTWQNYKEQLEAVSQSGVEVKILSTTFGALSKEEITDIRKQHPTAVIMGTATSVPEAIHLEQTGCDVIVAQGAESGGHRGTFLHEFGKGMIGTFTLVPQVVSAVSVPVIAAGGIMDGKGIAAALALGSSGVSLGTAFLTSLESPAPADYKKSLTDGRGQSTVITSHYSGRPARAVANKFTDEMEDTPKARFPFQHSITTALKKKAREEQHDLAMYLCGQGAPMCRTDQPTISQIVETLFDEYKEAVSNLAP